MQMQIESVHLGAVVVLAPQVFEDERGFFLEEFRLCPGYPPRGRGSSRCRNTCE